MFKFPLLMSYWALERWGEWREGQIPSVSDGLKSVLSTCWGSAVSSVGGTLEGKAGRGGTRTKEGEGTGAGGVRGDPAAGCMVSCQVGAQPGCPLGGERATVISSSAESSGAGGGVSATLLLPLCTHPYQLSSSSTSFSFLPRSSFLPLAREREGIAEPP